ncbi:HAD family hydrolase [Alicyclobacillus fastidiosus]|uniref:D,D-heptose 1,7-bisphosphate phosphatase n=1 Tax=Alicyclobacillus fastidiosus TaxID=392011 RepID=A0ABY6ZQ23_9BACL|nr:HAD family hydrolase [Alicyclobacillus fastidiosus]WAH44201.1 HAD family hydrolase [Alicyclobacillus fastidiosus]GMA60517.1 histidinol phosphate phosphatase [Alicyclobacillus fastidiosus]
MRPAVFLDRDGVINDHRRYVNEPDDFYLFPFAPEAIARLNEADFFVGVVTNQGGIGLGYMTEESLREIHKKMSAELEAAGARLDDIMYCPHAPKAGCRCRKPKPGMIELLARRHDLDVKRSYMVGDRDVDVLAGRAAGCKTIFVGDGTPPVRVKPDAHVRDIAAAAQWILRDAGRTPSS